MATRTVRLGVTVGVPDAGASVSEIKDAEGRTVRAATVGVRYVPAGQSVELETDEADRLEARFPYQPMDVQNPNAIPTKSVR